MRKSHIVTLAILGLLALVSPTVQAVDAPVGAKVTLSQTPLDISQLTNMDFSELTIPSNTPAVWTISPINPTFTLTKTGGNSLDVVLGDHSPGGFLIVGAPSLSVVYSALITTNFSGTGLTLSNVTLAEFDPTPAGDGAFALVVGADLTITTDAVPGFYNDAVITVTVNYE